MKVIALTGLHGAGKDTVADALPARKLAFADTLYREVAETFGTTQARLRMRDMKEVEQDCFAIGECRDSAFFSYIYPRIYRDPENLLSGWEVSLAPRSPRQILQWWGDYRRDQDPEYFVEAVRRKLGYATVQMDGAVITDVRQANEAAMVRSLGGQIWQVVRPGHEPPRTGHHTETDGSEFAPDVVLVNSQGIAELQAAALEEWMK